MIEAVAAIYLIGFALCATDLSDQEVATGASRSLPERVAAAGRVLLSAALWPVILFRWR